VSLKRSTKEKFLLEPDAQTNISSREPSYQEHGIPHTKEHDSTDDNFSPAAGCGLLAEKKVKKDVYRIVSYLTHIESKS